MEFTPREAQLCLAALAKLYGTDEDAASEQAVVEQAWNEGFRFGKGYDGFYHDCSDRDMKRVDSPANSSDWRETGRSSQGYQVYRCQKCGAIHGCRHQYDAGTGHDDRWHRFGHVDPATVKRHY